MSTDLVVETDALTKRYAAVTAVAGIDLSIQRGQVYGFLGPNGAGKTTTLRMLVGLVRPTAGSARVLGVSPGRPAALTRTGSMIEGPGFYPYLSGRDNLRVIARLCGASQARIVPVLETVDLASRAADRFSTYSMGMKQRLGVAAALLKDPELVILDEPTNGLDPAGMRDMRALIAALGSEGRTVILSSHLMAEVEQLCHRVAVISNGRLIAESSVDDLRGESDLVVAATPMDVARRTLEALPDVAEVCTTPTGELRVRVDDRHTAGITRALVRAGVDVVGLRRDERALEEVFLEITDDGGAGDE